MARKVAYKGAEYVHRTGEVLQDFRTSELLEEAILREDMDKLWDNLNTM